MKRRFRQLGQGSVALIVGSALCAGLVQADPRTVDLRLRMPLEDVLPPWVAPEPRPENVACDAKLFTIRFDRSGDTRRGEEERTEFTSNVDGGASAEEFFTQMTAQNTRLDRAFVDQMFADSCTPGDPAENYRNYLRQPFQRAAAVMALGRILDNEADKRKISPRVSRDRARFALDSFLVKMAIQRRYFGIQGGAVRRGTWSQAFLDSVTEVLEQQRQMTGLATSGEASGRSGCSRDSSAAAPREAGASALGDPRRPSEEGGWLGWQFFYNAGIRPCPASGAPRDYTFDEVMNMPAPTVGSPQCHYSRSLVCPAAVTSATRRGPFCGMTALELYAEMKRQVTAEAANATARPTTDPTLAALLPTGDAASAPICRGFSAPAAPTNLGRLYDIPVSWTPYVRELEGEVHLLEEEGTLPWSTVGNDQNGVNIRLREMGDSYYQLVDSVGYYVLQGYYTQLRRSAIWNQLVEERYPDRAWQGLFRSSRETAERYYRDLTGNPSQATCSRRSFQVYDLELSGPNAAGAAAAILAELDPQIPAFNERLANSTAPVERGDGSTECRVRTTEEIVAARDAWYASQAQTALRTARSVIGRANFRGVQATARERVVSVENSDSLTVSPTVSPATGYPAESDRELNLAPYYSSFSGNQPAFVRYQAGLPDGRVVLRFILNGRTEGVAFAPMRVGGRLNPELFGAGNPARGIRPGSLRVEMDAKAQALVFRELAYYLFQQNRLAFNSRACAQANVECIWDARTMAEAMFPEMEYFEPLGNMGSRGRPYSSSLGYPELYGRVKKFDTRLFVTALGIDNSPPFQTDVVYDESTLTDD